MSSLANLDEYPTLIVEAGLRLGELVDVSEHTRKTVPVIAASVLGHWQEFERHHGVELPALLGATLPTDVPLTDIGCLIAVAHRPHTRPPA
jgi:hypothetical protein